MGLDSKGQRDRNEREETGRNVLRENREAQRTLRFTSEINSLAVSRRLRSATARNSIVIYCSVQGRAPGYGTHRWPLRKLSRNTGSRLYSMGSIKLLSFHYNNRRKRERKKTRNERRSSPPKKKGKKKGRQEPFRLGLQTTTSEW